MKDWSHYEALCNTLLFRSINCTSTPSSVSLYTALRCVLLPKRKVIFLFVAVILPDLASFQYKKSLPVISGADIENSVPTLKLLSASCSKTGVSPSLPISASAIASPLNRPLYRNMPGAVRLSSSTTTGIDFVDTIPFNTMTSIVVLPAVTPFIWIALSNLSALLDKLTVTMLSS